MGTTSTNSWPYPESSDYVADGATAIENLADAIDASLPNADKIPRGVLAFTLSTGNASISTSLTDIATMSYTLTRQTRVLIGFAFPLVLSNTGASYTYNVIQDTNAAGSPTETAFYTYKQVPLFSSGLHFAILTQNSGSYTWWWCASTNAATCIYDGAADRYNQMFAIDIGGT